MSLLEETIDATLDSTGHLHLSHVPCLPPGPVVVTIRPALASAARRGLADVIGEIAAGQRARGFPGRSAAEIQADEDVRQAEDNERDRELDLARRTLDNWDNAEPAIAPHLRTAKPPKPPKPPMPPKPPKPVKPSKPSKPPKPPRPPKRGKAGGGA